MMCFPENVFLQISSLVVDLRFIVTRILKTDLLPDEAINDIGSLLVCDDFQFCHEVVSTPR